MARSKDNAPQQATVRLGKDGGLLIPLAFRKALGVKIGNEVILYWKDGELRITTMKRRIERAQQHARQYVKPGVSLVDELIAERREAAKRERS